MSPFPTMVAAMKRINREASICQNAIVFGECDTDRTKIEARRVAAIRDLGRECARLTGLSWMISSRTSEMVTEGPRRRRPVT